MPSSELEKLIAAAQAEADKIKDEESRRLVKRYLRLASESL